MEPQQQQQQQIMIAREPKSTGTAYVLWIFLGGLGLHRIYLDRTGSGVAQLVLSIVGWATIWVIIGIFPLIVVWIWLLVDLFLIPDMVREANQRVGVGYAVAPQMVVNIGSDIRERAYEERPSEEAKQQRMEETQPRQEVGTRAEAKMLPPMPQQLASVHGIVDLSADEALDEAQGFLTRQGYEVVRRADHSLTMRRGGQQFFLPDSASAFTSTLEVLVHPQSGGGVRMKIMGYDSDPVPRQQQAQWSEWADSLPRKMGEEDTSEAVPQGRQAKEEAKTADEETTVSRGEANADSARDVSDLLERFEAAEDRLGVRLEGLFARVDQANRHIHLNGELHANDEAGELGRDLEIIATVHDSSGRVMHKQSITCRSESFFGFDAFSLSMEAGGDPPAKIRVYPKAL